MTGYEQVRSVAAALAGDQEAAESIEMSLLETGVCGGADRSRIRPCTAIESTAVRCACAGEPEQGTEPQAVQTGSGAMLASEPAGAAVGTAREPSLGKLSWRVQPQCVRGRRRSGPA